MLHNNKILDNFILYYHFKNTINKMSRRRNVWIALGLAGLAYYLFKMKPEDKQRIKDTVKKYGDKALDYIPEDLREKLGLRKKEDYVGEQ